MIFPAIDPSFGATKTSHGAADTVAGKNIISQAQGRRASVGA